MSRRERILFLIVCLTAVLAPVTISYIQLHLDDSENADLYLRKTVEFRIDASFRPEELRDIQEAINEWNKKSGDLVYLSGIVVEIPDWEKILCDHDNISTIYNGQDPLSWKGKKFKRWSEKSIYLGITFGPIGDIFILTKNSLYFKLVVMHEIGHVLMGGYHSNNSNDLMYPYISSTMQGITDNDIRFLKWLYTKYY